MQVHDSDVTLVRHIERFDASVATSCGGATPWQSLNRLPGHVRKVLIMKISQDILLQTVEDEQC